VIEITGDHIYLTALFERKLKDMEENVDYLMDLPKEEIAMRYAALQEAITHFPIRNLIWREWRYYIRLWEDNHVPTSLKGEIDEKGQARKEAKRTSGYQLLLPAVREDKEK